MSIINRRNAIIGWGFWQLRKRSVKRKAKNVAPSVESGRPNKPFLAFAVAGLVGALSFWRKRRTSESS